MAKTRWTYEDEKICCKFFLKHGIPTRANIGNLMSELNHRLPEGSVVTLSASVPRIYRQVKGASCSPSHVEDGEEEHASYIGIERFWKSTEGGNSDASDGRGCQSG